MAPNKSHVLGFQIDEPHLLSSPSFAENRTRLRGALRAKQNFLKKNLQFLQQDNDIFFIRLIESIGLFFRRPVFVVGGVNEEFKGNPFPNDMIKNAKELSPEEYPVALLMETHGKIIYFEDKMSGYCFYPAFQWQDGRVHPNIALVVEKLHNLPQALSNWQMFAWFASTNGWLNDDAPMDRLDDLGALLSAVEHERHPMGD